MSAPEADLNVINGGVLVGSAITAMPMVRPSSMYASYAAPLELLGLLLASPATDALLTLPVFVAYSLHSIELKCE